MGGWLMELSRLCEMQGISGREELVRMAIFRECAEVLLSLIHI